MRSLSVHAGILFGYALISPRVILQFWLEDAFYKSPLVVREEQLLFQSGSWVVDAKGKDALVKLGKVLQTQPEVGILVEGHTDNVPYKGSGAIEDNWDLSVKRATAIVKILTANSSINPTQLSASGRSEYFPLDAANTKEAKAKNRRTEIIITPKLNELFKILEGN